MQNNISQLSNFVISFSLYFAGGSALTDLNLNNFSNAVGIGIFTTPFSATDGGNSTYDSTMTSNATLNSQKMF